MSSILSFFGLGNTQEHTAGGEKRHLKDEAISAYRLASDENIQRFRNRHTEELSAKLARCDALDFAEYDALWRATFIDNNDLIIGQQEYGKTHKQRFWELFNAIAILTENNQAPEILEFGASEFSAFYKALFPGCQLDTSDRPVDDDYIGFTETVCKRISRCRKHRAIDLEHPQSITDLPTYDVIVFTEVLEHLVVNPVELISRLINLLKPDGALYITTPNFFRRENLEKIAKRQNPQELYPVTGGNWDAHFHHREYCMSELLNYARQAGASVDAFYFSGCWDIDRPVDVPEERGNLVTVLRGS